MKIHGLDSHGGRRQRMQARLRLLLAGSGLSALSSSASVQEYRCRALHLICFGSTAAQQAAAEAGALAAIVDGMRRHASSPGVQEYGCRALGNICLGNDAAGLARKQAAVDAHALEAIVEGMRRHAASAGVQKYGGSAVTAQNATHNDTSGSAPGPPQNYYSATRNL